MVQPSYKHTFTVKGSILNVQELDLWGTVWGYTASRAMRDHHVSQLMDKDGVCGKAEDC